MIIVSGTLEIDPARRDRAIEAGETMAAASREEPGCLAYGFWADPVALHRFRVFEEWESEEALTAHFATPHLAAFAAAFSELGVHNTDVHRYTVTEKTKLM